MTGAEVLSNGLAIGIVIAIGVGLYRIGQFCAACVWPYMTERDDEERQRQHELRCVAQASEQRMIAALDAMAIGLENPIRVTLVESPDIYHPSE